MKTKESPTSYRPALYQMYKSCGEIGDEVSLQDVAQLIQQAIDTVSLRDLIDELADLYEPTEDMEASGESSYPLVMQPDTEPTVTVRAFWGHECQYEAFTFNTKAEAVAFSMGVAAGSGWDKHFLTCGEPQTYIVQEQTVVDGWINNWHDDGEPQTFDSYKAAEYELIEFEQDIRTAVARGDMTHRHERGNFRIIPIDLEN